MTLSELGPYLLKNSPHRIVTFAPGDFLCVPGDPARELWLIRSGRVAIRRSTTHGSRRGLEIMLPGELIGLPALTSLQFPNEIEARTPTGAAAFYRDDVFRLMGRRPELAQALLSLMGQRLHFVEEMLALSSEPVERRLSATLSYLHEKFGKVIPLTRGEIAEMAGTTPETVMRLLSRLEADGVVRRRIGAVEMV